MKKLFAIIAILLGVNMYTLAYDFQSEQLLYTILNTNPPSVRLDGHVNGTSAQGDLVIPEEVTFDGVTYKVVSIQGYAFYECKHLKNISIPYTIQEIGIDAFTYCNNIDSVYYNAKHCADITWFKQLVFDQCTGHLVIGDSVDRIPKYMFRQGDFDQLTIIGNSNTVIGEQAFLFCEKLSGTLSLGKVAHIERGAFLDNDTISITSITIDREQPPTLEFAAFQSISKDISVNVPCGSIELYQNAEYWNEFTLFHDHLIYSVQAVSEDENKGVVDLIKVPNSCNDLMVEVSAIPNDGYEFLQWEIDGDTVSTENPYFFDLDKDVSLIARFRSHPDSLLLPHFYGFLYQPNHATITLDPNSSFGADYGDFQAGFQYYPNGLLYMQRALSVYPNDEICDYDETLWFNYDSDLHVVEQHDTYYGMGAQPFVNYYVYEDGLLMTYTRYFDNYHEDLMILEDSTSYAYDELRRLQTEKQLRVNRYYKELSYEYHDNETVITTEGYSNGTNGDWIRLDKETRGFSEDSLLLTQQNEPYNDSATLVTYGYDEQGHRVSALTQKRYNGVWESRKLVQYHFNPYGCLTLAEIKTWQENEWVDANRAVYELDEMGYPAVVTFEKWDGEAWVNGVWQADFYLYNEDHLKQQNDMLYDYKNFINKIEMSYLVTENPREPLLPNNSEWYYEILNDDGSVTYQHLEYAADTTIGNERPKIIVRSNTQYDRDTIITEVTHEYIYDNNGIIYWWNKDLEAFTMLYDLTADVGDEWEIKVGTESLIMHVDAVENYEYDGKTYRMLRVSDENGLFSGNIVSGVGHLTSFFPERLMDQGKGYRVTGLRCYWVEGNLILKIDRDDCDAIYAELHNGIEEQPTDNAAFAIYPNPANNILFVQTVCTPSLPAETYRITNLMGQTILSGNITAENQQINIERLTAGMYFITLGNATQKFVVK